MNPERWQKLQELFNAAVDLPAPERVRYLEKECGPDSTLLRQVHSLIASETADQLESAVHRAVVDLASSTDVGSIIGQYRILKKLGEGGMGVVYEAEQSNPRRNVALKVIRAGRYATDRHRRLFQREAEALGRLRHPGIATIYESGITPDGQPFFAMELVTGQTLSTLLDQERPAAAIRRDAVRARLDLFLAICDAVTYAHQNGVIHRDLKPSNILVQVPGSDTGSGTFIRPQVKILDFGLARITEQEDATLTEAGVVQGSLPYMSPEQARGDASKIDIRTDIYSLGVLLYELLTGRHPYLDHTPALVEGLSAICNTPPRRFREIVPRYDEDLETIVFKALEKEPERRYSSVATLAADLERYLTDQPIVARPQSTVYQIRKLIRRNRMAFAFLMTALVMLVAFAVSTWIQSQRIRTERDRANQEAATSKQVSDFLLGMFREANPAEAKGVLTARDLLDSGRKRLENALKDQPELRARLYDNIGIAYTVIGPYSEAKKILEDSIALRRATYGPDSLREADTWNALSDVEVNLGNFDAAVKAARRAVEILEKHPKELDPATLAKYVAALATAHSLKGDNANAEKEILRVVEIDRTTGRDTPAKYGHLQSLGMVYRRQGRFAEASTVLREAVAGMERHLGRNATGVTRNELGMALNLSGHHSEAEKVLREAREIVAQVYGPEHPNIAIISVNIAYSLRDQGRLTPAELEVRRGMTLFEKVLGPDHPRMADFWSALGEIQGLSGRMADARDWTRKALARYEERMGADNIRTLACRLRLAQFDRKEGKSKAAQAALASLIEQFERTGQEQTHEAGLAWRELGAVQLQAGDASAAEASLGRAVEMLNRIPGPEHGDTRKAASLLAQVREKGAGPR